MDILLPVMKYRLHTHWNIVLASHAVREEARGADLCVMHKVVVVPLRMQMERKHCLKGSEVAAIAVAQ
ncbi:hypothetical protein GBAR_LOCUS27930 [Geodia barretti]|uniref:Uncharacterized protein n=1 Tax=Geodia barretti TaxID=519541 RepID=A0AA35TNJ5_GEOBA|nr:hypothetical protein GBAR_LOCUS27930 [Geodia barretti]